MMNDDAKANAEPKALASRESVEIPLMMMGVSGTPPKP
jgi:hypothetical protein